MEPAITNSSIMNSRGSSKSEKDACSINQAQEVNMAEDKCEEEEKLQELLSLKDKTTELSQLTVQILKSTVWLQQENLKLVQILDLKHGLEEEWRKLYQALRKTKEDLGRVDQVIKEKQQKTQEKLLELQETKEIYEGLKHEVDELRSKHCLDKLPNLQSSYENWVNSYLEQRRTGGGGGEQSEFKSKKRKR